MNPYDIIYDLNEEVTKLTRQLEVAKASLNKWESVFGHLGTPDEVGNEWAAMSDRLEAVEKERDELRSELTELRHGAGVANDTIKALRAEVQTWQDQAKAYWSKITEMEKQGPQKLSPRMNRGCLLMSQQRAQRKNEMTKDKFQREERYLVFKLADVENDFFPSEISQLLRLHETQQSMRKQSGKPPLDCVVVESDWPEYEPTWRAIEARMSGHQPALSVPDGWKLAPIKPTPVMKTAGIGVEVYQDSPPSTDCLTWEEVEAIYTAMLAAAPKVEGK